ncbi:MAG: dethiobiotin synthase [Candidatus Melainabacteria bacterium]|nr:dethiobiotin synthase [Candidatus Melainabacteria bacterium]
MKKSILMQFFRVMITNHIFISATDTGVGKTHFAIELLKSKLEQGLKLEELAYYKVIQCGKPSDYDEVQASIPGITSYCSYDLAEPASPDYAASLEGVKIDLSQIKQDWHEIKSKHKFVVVEGAGGLAVPINDAELVSDIALALDLPLVLVISARLGTINQTLLSVEHAQNKGIKILGIKVSDLDRDQSERELASLASIQKITGLSFCHPERSLRIPQS